MISDLKKAVCDANRALHHWRLVSFTWGNVSGILREKGQVVIKPSGVPYEKLTPEAMVVVDLEGKVVEGRLRPSTDTPSHLKLYSAWPEIGGVAHVHSTYATMFAQAGRAIPCLGTTHADHFRGTVPLTRPLTEKEVKENYEENTGALILEEFADKDPRDMPAVLVANHGPFTWGKDAREAAENSRRLEEIARMAIGSFLLNPDLIPIPQFLLEKHFRRKHGPAAYYGQKNPK